VSGRRASKVARSGRARVWQPTGKEGRWHQTGGVEIDKGVLDWGGKGAWLLTGGSTWPRVVSAIAGRVDGFGPSRKKDLNFFK
jgi:hypothetical protein